jgi:hypothetical protein
MADNKSTSRINLKAFFQAGDIPEERHFEALIHSGINQVDDGIRKSAARPLEIQTPIGETQEVIYFYEAFAEGADPNWRISLQDALSEKGLLIHNEPDRPDFFIRQHDGFVGIGTSNPQSQLEVDGTITAKFLTALLKPEEGEDKGIFFTNDPTGASSKASIRFYARNDKQSPTLEIGATNYATDHLSLMPDGGNVGIGTTVPTARLDVAGLAKAVAFSGRIEPTAGNTKNDGISFPKDPGGGSGDQAWIRYYRRTGEHTTLEIGISNDREDHIALMPQRGNVGIGTNDPAAKLEVRGDVKADSFFGLLRPTAGQSANSGIVFPSDPGGGSGDRAWIQYYRRTGEQMTLEIGVSNDVQDHIALMPQRGNVGIGTNDPTAKLEVRGDVKADSFAGLIQPTAGDAANSGVVFPRDPGGGSGDQAWIRYYARTSEHMTLEIGVSNDLQDHIVLMPSGNVGIGANDPAAKLDVKGGIKLAGALHFDADSLNTAQEFKINLGGGFGLSDDASTLFYSAKNSHSWRGANGASESMLLTNGANGRLVVRGRGESSVAGSLQVGGGLQVEGAAQALSFSGQLRPTAGTTNNDGIVFTEDPGGGILDRAWIRYYPRSGQATTLEMGVSNNRDDHIALMPSGNVGIGTPEPTVKLDVRGVAKAFAFDGQLRPTAGNTAGDGIVFPSDPGGGSGDQAWIRYYPRSGEAMTLEIGVSNDRNDHIALMPTGNVGIGTNAPGSKLDVRGNVKAFGFEGQLRPTAGNTAGDGIVFPSDPGGGSGDRAWIRYYPRSGEAMTLEIGVSNDRNDHIALMPSGNVGIGTNDPRYQLDVSGTLRTSRIRIGNTEIGEAELEILRKLANNQLHVKIMSQRGYVLDNYADRVNDGDRDRTIQFQRDVGYPQTRMKLVIW